MKRQYITIKDIELHEAALAKAYALYRKTVSKRIPRWVRDTLIKTDRKFVRYGFKLPRKKYLMFWEARLKAIERDRQFALRMKKYRPDKKKAAPKSSKRH